MSKNNHAHKMKVKQDEELHPEKIGPDFDENTGLVFGAPSPMPDCTAYTVQCYKNGQHNNFRILTMKIVRGFVVDIKYSDPYASFEFIDQLNVLTDRACQSLNMRWKDGLCLNP